MNSWFECKVTYEKAGEDGLLTKTSESYLVDTVNFTDAENRITTELEPFVTGEFIINGIKKVKIAEIIDSEVDTDDRWWKAKVILVMIDEDKDVEKHVAVTNYIKAETLEGAVKYLTDFMEDSVYPYKLSSVIETQVVDVYKYQLSK